MAFGIFKPMLLAVGIEVSSRRLEVGRFAFRILMHVNCVFSRWQVFQIQLDFHAILGCLQRGIPDAFAFCVL